ncbi:DUF1127 domain-containing protein [uncultured Bradyrhizobium sp.]|jgi:uncharacterized protein YjiS (DUF1127 family)|uniref:DUF1127 domain-containing protein n=1 Tax=uncultured Bradyrhizobium sp. TaxID=199684 RepID=UPI0026202268|nr:DUF1127 domain-containing protein [uncultured Bradyrhizobium sp.]
MALRLWQAVVETIRRRRERSQDRCRLAAMTERELQDCGTTRAEIEYELHRHWRRK